MGAIYFSGAVESNAKSGFGFPKFSQASSNRELHAAAGEDTSFRSVNVIKHSNSIMNGEIIYEEQKEGSVERTEEDVLPEGDKEMMFEESKEVLLRDHIFERSPLS